MKILGTVNTDEGEKALYVKNIDDDRYVYYLGDNEIGGYDKDVSMQKIIFKENSIENELSAEIKDEINKILEDVSLEEIQETEKDYEQEKVGEIKDILGLEDEEQIERIAEIDLEQEFIEDTKEKNEKEKDENESIKFATEEDVNVKQEMNFENKTTDMKTLGQKKKKEGKIPNIPGKKFTKMGIIESDQMDELTTQNGEKSKVNSTRYSFVAIATDGTVVPMNLEQDHQEGNNPLETNYQVNQDGSVEKDDVLSRFKIGEGTFSVKNGQYGELKIYHSPRKTLGGESIEGNKSLDRELETDNVWELKKEERDLASEYGDGYRSVEEGYQEVRNIEKENEGNDCDEITTDDIDGEEGTKGHNHDEEFIEKTTEELLEVDVINEVFTRKEIEETIRRAKENYKDNLTNEQIAEKVAKDLEQDASIYSREK